MVIAFLLCTRMYFNSHSLCFMYRGDTFRHEFSRLREVRSLIPTGVNMIALTATASKSLQQSVIQTLGMRQPFVLSVSPHKPNITLAVTQFKSIEHDFEPVVSGLRQARLLYERTIIYCNLQSQCATLYLYFRKQLGSEMLEPKDAPDISRFRLIDMYTSCTESRVKDQIIESFTNPLSPLRIVISTIAFGMGIDCPDVRSIIHYGPPKDIESYVQQIGRAGRDQKQSHAKLLYYKPRHPIEDSMFKYCVNVDVCRRFVLFNEFGDYNHESINTLCACCDICSMKCKCESCIIKL